MSDAIQEFESKTNRKGIALTYGGRPLNPAPLSAYGMVTLGKKGEEWPMINGVHMMPIVQIDLSNLPFKPAGLEDVALLVLFMDSNAEHYPFESNNGTNWELRTYSSIDELVPIETPDVDREHWPTRQMYLEVIENEYPDREDAFSIYGEMPEFDDEYISHPGIPEEVNENYSLNYNNSPNSKLGGWPSLIHDSIEWAPWNKEPAKPKYVFQIYSEDTFPWGGNGFGYFGRGTTPGTENEWFGAWQHE